MSHHEKNTYAHLLSTLLVMGGYIFYVSRMYQAGGFEGPDALVLLGRMVLIMVGAGVVANIIMAIVFNIVFAIAANEPKPSFVADERDKLFELKAMSTSAMALGVGFVLSMVALALGQPAFMVINMIVIAGALSDVLGGVVKLVLYRRGF